MDPAGTERLHCLRRHLWPFVSLIWFFSLNFECFWSFFLPATLESAWLDTEQPFCKDIQLRDFPHISPILKGQSCFKSIHVSTSLTAWWEPGCKITGIHSNLEQSWHPAKQWNAGLRPLTKEIRIWKWLSKTPTPLYFLLLLPLICYCYCLFCLLILLLLLFSLLV